MQFKWLLVIFVIFAKQITEISMYTLNLTSSCGESSYCLIKNISLSSIEPIHSAETTTLELLELIIRDSRLRQIPSSIFNQAENLRILVMNKCGLNNLSTDDFNKADYLQSLNLQNNHISQILDHTFKILGFLERLYLGFNNIYTLQTEAFDGLEHLEYLDLQHNEVNSLGSLKNLRRLYFIDLSHNSIEYIDEYSFKGLENLKTILINNNKITNFEINAIDFIPHLNVLDISNNINIENLYAMKVDILLAHSSGLKFCKIISAFKIYACNNNLKSIKIIDKLSVHEISLSGNKFETVDDFAEMLNLDWLDLSKNQITTLKTPTMEHYLNLPSLTYLNLANNKLTNLTADSLWSLQKLISLDLRENDLNFQMNKEDLTGVLGNLENYNEQKYIARAAYTHQKQHSVDTFNFAKNWLLIVLSILSFLLVALILYGLYRGLSGQQIFPIIPSCCPQKRHINAGATNISGMVSHRLNELDSAM